MKIFKIDASTIDLITQRAGSSLEHAISSPENQKLVLN